MEPLLPSCGVGHGLRDPYPCLPSTPPSAHYQFIRHARPMATGLEPTLEQKVPSFSRPQESEDSPSCPLRPETGTKGRGEVVIYPSTPPCTLTHGEGKSLDTSDATESGENCTPPTPELGTSKQRKLWRMQRKKVALSLPGALEVCQSICLSVCPDFGLTAVLWFHHGPAAPAPDAMFLVPARQEARGVHCSETLAPAPQNPTHKDPLEREERVGGTQDMCRCRAGLALVPQGAVRSPGAPQQR